MVRNIEYIIKIIILMIIVLIMFIPISNASSMDSILNDGDAFLQEGKNTGSNLIDQAQLKVEINNIYTVVYIIGIALSVIIGAILGIKFMVGTIEEQAKVKETLIPYAVGCIVVFGAFGIWKLIITMGGNIFN